ncbi:hypothetical protein LAZ67_9002439 [Cordylochernes scorpioides]|uniref:Transposase n=1 Tax=Cordylochernes scorpioides TaxID=51811 RepID=A0ABY6KTT4_9ARAC|nr:hypothetical protein LAZ67_9002439 [Cordylochernes scorpioides]
MLRPIGRMSQLQNVPIRFQLVPHPPYSPDLAQFFLLPNLKKWLGGREFTPNRGVSDDRRVADPQILELPSRATPAPGGVRLLRNAPGFAGLALPDAVKLTSVAKATIYKYHLGLELGNASQHIDLPTLWERTLAVHRWRSLSRGGRHQ